MKSKNPLSGKAFFNKEGDLLLEHGIPFGGQLRPKVGIREWFYLLIHACKERPVPKKKNLERFMSEHLGSEVTQWRTKKKLMAKGFL